MQRWPEVRAALIAGTILFGLVDGCPLPPSGTVTSWTPLQPLVEPVRAVQAVVERPVAWIGPALQIGQRWALYQAPGRDKYRMWIEGQGEGGGWRLLFRAGDPDHAEDAATIEYGRVWGTWDPTDKPAAQYPAFASWISRRFLERDAGLTAVRVRMEKIDLVPGAIVPSGQFSFTRITTR